MPDRYKTMAILLAFTVALQAGLSAAEGGLCFLGGHPYRGQAFSVARPGPGEYALAVVGYSGRWSETLTVAELGGQPAARISLGSVEAWRNTLRRLWDTIRRMSRRRPSADSTPSAPSPSPRSWPVSATSSPLPFRPSAHP